MRLRSKGTGRGGWLIPLFFFLFSALPWEGGGHTVVKVIDGDTAVLENGVVLRYLGINAPERQEPFYREAAKVNERLTLRKKVRLEFEAGCLYDRGGRFLAYVFSGPEFVNASLIREGMAHLFCLQPLKYYGLFYSLQEEAREERRGIWGSRDFWGPLKITTVKGDAPGDDRYNLNGEYVRICNISPGLVELRGFRLCNRRGLCYTFRMGRLLPGYTALVFSGKGKDEIHGHQLKFFWNSPYPVWRNKGDKATLFDPSGRPISSFRFRPLRGRAPLRPLR
ncbi:MAG: hypothetical protein DRG31_01380 [Deltaproteobacteria bacterium]|nr:MAG: hypothetical protein DRG31_01380 [Deltaproteobacteria bacterium]